MNRKCHRTNFLMCAVCATAMTPALQSAANERGDEGHEYALDEPFDTSKPCVSVINGSIV